MHHSVRSLLRPVPRARFVKLWATITLAIVATLGTVSVAGAGVNVVLTDIPLHNTTAEEGTGSDCPDSPGAFWHFVIAPNNGTFHFVDIRLDLGEGLQSFPFIPNGGQDDNVFVQVPAGKTLTSLISGEADIQSDKGAQPEQFNLSHVCQGTGTTPPPNGGPPPGGETPPPGGVTPPPGQAAVAVVGAARFTG